MNGGGVKSRNFRRRSDDDSNPDVNAPSPAPKPRPPSATKPRSLLSFADDDETTTNRPISSRSSSSVSLSSKSASVHRITSSKDRVAAAPLPKISSLRPQTGEYTKEKLLELQKNARPLGTFNPKPSTSNIKETPKEPVIVLKGLENLVQAVEIQESKSEIVEEELSGLEIKEEEKDLKLIPDRATIAAIRAKRERLRQARSVAQDYISLERKSGGISSDEEDRDFRGRISETPVLEKISASVDFKVVEEVDEDNEEEDEERIWEEEQFRKGLGKRFDESSSGKQDNAPQVPVVSKEISLYGFSKSAETLSISQQAEVATRSLREGIGKLREAHGRTVSSLARTDENLEDALRNISDLEKSITAAGEKFVFMQKLRDFVSVLCSFLQDKAPYIEELEEQMQKLHQDRASAIRERRDGDDEDEIVEVEVAINAASSALSRGSSPALVSAAVSAAREGLNLPIQKDEFGRDLNRQKRLDRERRSESRNRRKVRSDSKIKHGEIEGEVSTDESETEADAYASSREELLQIADLVFSDAAEDYAKLSAVNRKFQEWKKLYSSSYGDAYMSLSLPLIFAPYVRLELLKWDPLHQKLDFCDMAWHDQLFSYGSEIENANDQDSNLIPELVEQVAVPALIQEIKHCWDVLSARETENAVFATSVIISYIQPSSKQLAELMAEIVTRLSKAAESVGVPAWSASAVRAVPEAARISAHRFGRCVRLLRNVCLWKDILSSRILQELALDLLVARKILPHLRSSMPYLQDAITRTERVVEAVAGVQSAKLQPLVDLVMEMGRVLEKRQAAGVQEETVGLARRLKKMLVLLNEYDRARAILKTFKLKEAL